MAASIPGIIWISGKFTDLCSPNVVQLIFKSSYYYGPDFHHKTLKSGSLCSINVIEGE